MCQASRGYRKVRSTYYWTFDQRRRRKTMSEQASDAGTNGRPVLDYPCGEAPAPGEVREIAPGVLWIRMPMPGSLNHINLWAVRDGEEGWAIFDTGLQT